MNSKKKIREFVLLEKSTPRKQCLKEHENKPFCVIFGCHFALFQIQQISNCYKILELLESHEIIE